jgi:hypothetical protein
MNSAIKHVILGIVLAAILGVVLYAGNAWLNSYLSPTEAKAFALAHLLQTGRGDFALERTDDFGGGHYRFRYVDVDARSLDLTVEPQLASSVQWLSPV